MSRGLLRLRCLVDPTRHHGFDQRNGDLSARLETLLVSPAGDMEEDRGPVSSLLERLRQTRVENEFAEIATGIFGDSNIGPWRRKGLPRLQEVILRGIRYNPRRKSRRSDVVVGLIRSLGRPGFQYGGQALLFP